MKDATKEILLYFARTIVALILILFFVVTFFGKSKQPPTYVNKPLMQENNKDENLRNSIRSIPGDDKIHPKQP